MQIERYARVQCVIFSHTDCTTHNLICCLNRKVPNGITFSRWPKYQVSVYRTIDSLVLGFHANRKKYSVIIFL